MAIKTKWILNILLPIVYFGLWNKFNLHFSRVSVEDGWGGNIKVEYSTFISCVFQFRVA